MTTRPLEALEALDRRFDLFDHAARDWNDAAESGFHPPLPVAGRSLVWGFPLLEAARRADKKALPVIEVEERAPGALLALCLRLENRAGGYSRAEQERVRRALEEWGAPADDPGLLALVTRDAPQKWLADARQYAACGPALKRLVEARLVDLKTAARVRDLPDDLFKYLLDVPARLTHSDRKTFLLSLWEIARRDRLGGEALSALGREILATGDPLRAIRARRYPELTRREARFRETAAPLAQRGVTVREPAGFEGDALEFRFRASSRGVFEKRTKALAEAGELVDRLFGLL